MDRVRCRCCHANLHFCPCCGAPLSLLRDSFPKSTQRQTLLTQSNTDAATHALNVNDKEIKNGMVVGTAGWWVPRLQLPQRPVSAFEVYVAKQRAADREGAVGVEESSAAAAQQSNTTSCSLVDSSVEATQTPQASSQVDSAEWTAGMASREARQHNESDDPRAVAAAWLQLTLTEKRLYEEIAENWKCSMQQRASRAEALTPSALSESIDPRAMAAAQPSQDCCMSDKAAAPAAISSFDKVVTPKLSLLGTPASASKAPSLSHKKSARTPHTGRNVTSFNLFRAAMKGRRWSMTEAAAVWQQMSAEEKSRYDAAAATCRTAAFRQARPPCPSAALDNTPVVPKFTMQEKSEAEDAKDTSSGAL